MGGTERASTSEIKTELNVRLEMYDLYNLYICNTLHYVVRRYTTL